MKILFLTRLYRPHVGGVEKHLDEVIIRLNKIGHQFNIIAQKFRKDLPSQEVINEKVVAYRISYPEIKIIGLLKIWYEIWKLRSLIKESDIIHIHDVFIWYLPFRLIYPNKKVYITFHGWEGKFPVPKRNILLNMIADKLTIKNLCAGKFIEKYYHVNADYIYYTATTPPRKSNYAKDKKLVIYVGRLDEDTGLSKILRSLTLIKDQINMNFCGDGPLMDECKKIGKVHGFINPSTFYQKASVSVSPGLTSVLEALSYKCRVITTFNNSLKRDYILMTPFGKWIVVKKSVDDMANEIVKFINHPSQARAEIELGYKWAITQSWDYITSLYLRTWEN